MRKIYMYICLAAAICAAAPGCAARSESDISISELIELTKQSSPIVGYCQLGEESSWRMENTESILDAAQSADVQLMYENGHQKQENQIKALRSFIVYKVDAIVLDPLTTTGWEAVLQEAEDAGIPVILTDRNVLDAPADSVVARVAPDYYAEGRRAAAFVLSKFKNTKGPVNIIELSGTQDSSAAQDRHDGFRETLGTRTRYRVIKSVSGDFMLSKGREAMRELLGQIDIESVDVIYSHNYDMTLGAIEALEEYGLVPGRDVQIVTCEAPDEAAALVGEGKVACAVGSSPDIGDAVLEVVQDVLDGKEVPEVTYVPQTMITRETLRQLEETDDTASEAGSAAPGAKQSHAR